MESLAQQSANTHLDGVNTRQGAEEASTYRPASPDVGRISTHDLEYHAQHAAMDIDLFQLSKGRFHNHREFVKVPGFFLSSQVWGRACSARGQVPSGYVMLGLNNDRTGSAPIKWCGHQLDTTSIAIAQGGDEFEFTTSEQSHETLMLVEQSVFDELLYDQATPLLNDKKVITVPPDVRMLFGNTLNSVIRKFVSQPDLLNIEEMLDANRCDLGDALIGVIKDANPVSHSTYLNQTISEATRILETSREVISITKLANLLNVSQRALEIGFRKYTGITPGVYSRRIRLSKAHQELANSNLHETKIGDVALKWGFNHPGRFSIAYHEMFDEMPSKTLKSSNTYANKLRLRPVAAVGSDKSTWEGVSASRLLPTEEF